MAEQKQTYSRRSFVKTGALATAGVTAFNILKSTEARAAEPIKVGLIGCGGRGKQAMGNCLHAAEGVQIVAFADLFPDKIQGAKDELAKFDQKVADDHCFLGFDAYKQVLKTDINYVILATPPVFRPPILTAAIEAKKHVFMEKPAAVDPPGIRAIIAAGEKAKELGLSIVAGTQRRHQKCYVETIKRIHEGAIGEIVAARAYWCGGAIGFGKQRPGMSDMEWQIRSWYHFLWLSGDHIVEQHVHNLDVINWSMKAHPVKAYGCGGRAWQIKGNIWDHHAVDFEYANGAHLMSLCRQIQTPKDNVSEFVVGTKGSSNCKDWIKAQEEWKFTSEYVDPYIQEHTDLIESIRNGKPVNEARNVAESTMTAILGRMAEYTGKEMTWDEAFNSNETVGLKEYKLGPVELAPVAIPGGKAAKGDEGWNPDPDSK